MQAFGIDIGGSGMKAGIVDLATGELVSDRYRIATPDPATPEAMADVARQLVRRSRWEGTVGICMPSVVQHGIVKSAANIDESWIGVDADAVFTTALGDEVTVINDADAAGMAEMKWGAGRGRDGVVMVFTFGTGIGSALFVDGHLVPNTELGHVELDGHDAEDRAAASARDRDGLSWKEWTKRVERYLRHIDGLFSPDLMILGGGASKQADKWIDHLDPGCEVVAAAMANNAGIAGAALWAPPR